MKKLITVFSICATVAILALPIAAHGAIAQDQCSVDSKNALYKTFTENFKTEQDKAYDAAKKYLACPADNADEGQQKIIAYLKNFVTKYEAADRKGRVRVLLYNEKKYPEAYALGKEILATEPDNLKILVDLGANGYLIANNPSLTGDALDYAKRALAALESGKSLDDWAPLPSKDTAIAYLNYTIGALTLEKDPGAALKNLLKAAQFETPLKKSPYTYAFIAGAYETGPYKVQSEEYKRVYFGKDETPESKLALANINQLVDRMIDGYARAVALAGNDANFAQGKAQWNESLTNWYKYRNNNTVDGLPQMIASILQKPLPPEPTPLTSLPPTSTPAATPATNSGTPGTGNGVASATTTGTTAPASTGSANKTTAPAGTKANGTKSDKPRRNHQ